MVGHPGQAYGQDLRDRVLNAKGSIREVALRFGVSESYVARARSRRRHQTDRNERKPDEQAGATSFQQLSELAMRENCDHLIHDAAPGDRRAFREIYRGITKQSPKNAVQKGIGHRDFCPPIRRHSWPMRRWLISGCPGRNTEMANPTAPMNFSAQTTN